MTSEELNLPTKDYFISFALIKKNNQKFGSCYIQTTPIILCKDSLEKKLAKSFKVDTLHILSYQEITEEEKELLKQTREREKEKFNENINRKRSLSILQK